MDDDERVVREEWHRIAGSDDVTIEDVVARHREPHRHYHTVAHVAWVLRAVEELLESPHGEEVDADAVRVAAIFHDVVYDPHLTDNERRSAEMAAEAVSTLGWSPERTALVTRLVLATAAHQAADTEAAVLLDADLSILGADDATYDRYVDAVRAEYAHVDDEAWRAGRAAVLREFVDRPAIYSTWFMRERAEDRARANLARELAALTAVDGR